jgi:hypothetical protein
MNLKLIACEICYRECCLLMAESPHRCDAEFLPKGLHDLGVEKMKPRIQERIDAVSPHVYDAVILAYGLCSNGIVGLESRHSRLVIPRAHDCITLFMGSRKRYAEYFAAHPGTYYRTTGWFERNDAGSAGEITVPERLGLHVGYEELVEKYGEENARYVMESMGDATAHYDRIAFINMGLKCEARFRDMAREEAREKGWTFDRIEGSLDLLRRLIHGEWDDDFLVLQPGESVRASHDDGVINPCPCP